MLWFSKDVPKSYIQQTDQTGYVQVVYFNGQTECD